MSIKSNRLSLSFFFRESWWKWSEVLIQQYKIESSEDIFAVFPYNLWRVSRSEFIIVIITHFFPDRIESIVKDSVHVQTSDINAQETDHFF